MTEAFPAPISLPIPSATPPLFFWRKVCDVKGVVLTISQEELSFESALWLAQSYLASG